MVGGGGVEVLCAVQVDFISGKGRWPSWLTVTGCNLLGEGLARNKLKNGNAILSTKY